MLRIVPNKEFTFHHVSIKTLFIARPDCPLQDSHSTMYLLKRVSYPDAQEFETKFTFHHVSIKTIKSLHSNSSKYYSHSTMYLLKLFSEPIFVLNFNHSHSTMYLLKR